MSTAKTRKPLPLGGLTTPAKGGGVTRMEWRDNVQCVLVRQGRREWWIPLPVWQGMLATVQYPLGKVTNARGTTTRVQRGDERQSARRRPERARNVMGRKPSVRNRRRDASRRTTHDVRRMGDRVSTKGRGAV